MHNDRVEGRDAASSRGVLWNDGLGAVPSAPTFNERKNMEQQIKQIAEALGFDASPCGYAFLNTTVAEVLFRGGHGMSGNTAHPVYRAELVLAMLQEISTLRQALDDANGICRSAYQIAERSGSANWPAFRAKLAESLERQHKVMYPLGT